MSFCTVENSHEFFVTGMECYGTTTQEIMARNRTDGGVYCRAKSYIIWLNNLWVAVCLLATIYDFVKICFNTV